MKYGRSLKFAIVASAALIISLNIFGCPTCVGRLMLGVKKPFFEQYRPKPINRRRKSRKKVLEKRESSFIKPTKKQKKNKKRKFRKKKILK